MKLSDIKEKTVQVIGKIGKKTVIIACAVLLIGTAVLLNFILRGNSGKDTDTGVDPKIDLSDLSSSAGDSDKSNSEYFATMALNRQRARDEAVEVLQSVANSSTAVEEMKSQAAEDMKQIALDISNESNIETLVIAKGFEKCIAVISGETASVIVESDGLLPNQISQIKEIVYEQSGILPENLKIVAKK